MRILKKGAEASIILGDWFGEDAIFKVRELKSYRQSNIDTKIRVFRTLHEASFLTEAKKIGVITPLVYFVDRQKAEIVMQFVNGLRLKDIVNASDTSISKWFEEVGRYVARLHEANIIHGDITTSNFLIAEDKLSMIDFGLSFYSNKIEDKAVDIHLLRTVLQSANTDLSSKLMDHVFRGYFELSNRNKVNDFLKRLKIVERRGRYKFNE